MINRSTFIYHLSHKINKVTKMRTSSIKPNTQNTTICINPKNTEKSMYQTTKDIADKFENFCNQTGPFAPKKKPETKSNSSIEPLDLKEFNEKTGEPDQALVEKTRKLFHSNNH